MYMINHYFPLSLSKAQDSILVFMRSFFFLLFVCVTALFAQQGYLYKTGFEPLADVCFADSLHGWACGANGTILRTANGGETWENGAVPEGYFIEALCFVNEHLGWAVGGLTFTEATDFPALLNTSGTRNAMGIILKTDDGGITWHEQNVPAFYPDIFSKPPAWLLDVDFIDSLRGWVCGSFGSVYRTQDAGQTWEQFAYSGLSRTNDTASGKWFFGIDFIDATTGFLVGEDSLIKKTIDGGVTWSYIKEPAALINAPDVTQSFDEGKRYNFFRDVLFITAQTGWAVGDNACLLKTVNSGATWIQQVLPLSAPLLDLADIKKIRFISSDTGWAISNLGNGVLRTVNSGATWEWVRTDCPGWFNSIFFTDSRHGWAVGECGQIIHTHDGGATWEKQRGPQPFNGTIAPILIVHAHGDDEVIWGGGCLGAQYGLNASVPIVTLRTTKDARGYNVSRQGEIKKCELRTAAAIAGFSGHRTLDEFDTDVFTDHATEISSWGGSEDLMMAQIVEAMRCWKPLVVITHDSAYGEYGKQNHMSTSIIAHKAFDAAGDPLRFPEQITVAGLSAWSPKKLYSFWQGTPQQPYFHFSQNDTVVRSGHTYLEHTLRALNNYLSQYPSGYEHYVRACSSFVRIKSSVTCPAVENDLFAGTGYPIGVEKKAEKNITRLLSCYPTPFNPRISIRIGKLPARETDVQLRVFNIEGKLVKDFTDVGRVPIALAWDASLQPAGVYFVRLRTGNQIQTKTIVLSR